jgi:hypothetical protein
MVFGPNIMFVDRKVRSEYSICLAVMRLERETFSPIVILNVLA